MYFILHLCVADSEIKEKTFTFPSAVSKNVNSFCHIETLLIDMLRSKEVFIVDTNLFFDYDLLTFFCTNSKEFETFLASSKGEQVGVSRLSENKLNMFIYFGMVVSRI